MDLDMGPSCTRNGMNTMGDSNNEDTMSHKQFHDSLSEALGAIKMSLVVCHVTSSSERYTWHLQAFWIHGYTNLRVRLPKDTKPFSKMALAYVAKAMREWATRVEKDVGREDE